MSTRRLRVGACLSLSGRHARFGRQAAAALDVWRTWDGAADLVVEDDSGDRRELAAAIERPAPTCDILLGPYATHLMRTAGDVAAAFERHAGFPPDYPAVQATATAVIAAHCARLAGGTDRALLWAAAAELDTTTLFGAFAIDPCTGAQRAHEAVLTRWTRNGPARAGQ